MILNRKGAASFHVAMQHLLRHNVLVSSTLSNWWIQAQSQQVAPFF
jgi:hypothetical protein